MARASNDPGELFTIAEVAAKAKVNPKTVRRSIDRMEIAVTRIGDLVRISERAYNDWVRRNTHDPVL